MKYEKTIDLYDSLSVEELKFLLRKTEKEAAKWLRKNLNFSNYQSKRVAFLIKH